MRTEPGSCTAWSGMALNGDSSAESKITIDNHLKEQYPIATEKQIKKLIGF